MIPPEYKMNYDRKIFIDGGARKGESIDCFIKTRADLKGCDIHFFECNPYYIKTLEQLQKNSDYNVHVHPTALWNKEGEQNFYIAIDQWGDLGSSLDPTNKQKLDLEHPIIVKTITLSNFLCQFNKNDYIIVKLDIEGAEFEVVTDLLSTNKLSRINELYVEWHDSFYDKDFNDLRNRLYGTKNGITELYYWIW